MLYAVGVGAFFANEHTPRHARAHATSTSKYSVAPLSPGGAYKGYDAWVALTEKKINEEIKMAW